MTLRNLVTRRSIRWLGKLLPLCNAWTYIHNIYTHWPFISTTFLVAENVQAGIENDKHHSFIHSFIPTLWMWHAEPLRFIFLMFWLRFQQGFNKVAFPPVSSQVLPQFSTSTTADRPWSSPWEIMLCSRARRQFSPQFYVPLCWDREAGKTIYGTYCL